MHNNNKQEELPVKKSLMIGLLGALSMAQAATAQEYNASQKAHELAQQKLIIDTHIDVPYGLFNDWEGVTKATQRGDFDYLRAMQGGLNVPFMSIYIPAHLEQTPGASYQLAHQLIDSMEALAWRAPDTFATAYSFDDVIKQQQIGLMSISLGMENGSTIECDLINLMQIYDAGIRYVTLSHSQSNYIADSTFDIRLQRNGLCPFGKSLIKERN